MGDFIVVRDYPEVLDQVAKVIAQLDTRPRQVLIEGVILRARLTENNALGVDFNALGGVDFRVLGSTSVGGLNLTPGNVPPQKFDSSLGAVQTAFTGAVPEGGLSFGIITNNVATFIRALEEIVDLTIVANPKVLTVHGQPGRVIVGRKDGYLTTTVTQTAAVQTVEFIERGTQILFRPFVGDDGYVRMDIHPEDSDGGLTPANLPFKTTTEVTANVIVKDGRTLVIGGLFRDVASSRHNLLPYLGHIPLLGLLVSGKSDNAVREEVIVLLTPHIIDGDDATGSSARAKDEAERWRVLSHRGLLPWGRERPAQAHYRWALEHYRAGHTGSAVWDVDLALSLQPCFVDADRLRAELTTRQTAEADGSIVHDLVDQLIAQELAEPAPGEPQPAWELDASPEVLSAWVDVLVLGGRADDAREVLQRARTTTPGQPALQVMAARLCADATSSPDTARELETATLADPAARGIRERLAEVYTAAGRHADAVALWRELVSSTQDRAARTLCQRHFAASLASAGELDEARGVYRTLAAAQPENNSLRLSLAAVCLVAGHPDEALQAAEAVLRNTPENNDVRLLVALCYRRLGQISAAVDTLADMHTDADRAELIQQLIQRWQEDDAHG